MTEDRPNLRGLYPAEIASRLAAHGHGERVATLPTRLYRGLFAERHPSVAAIPWLGHRKRALVGEVFDDGGLELVERREADGGRSARHVFRLRGGGLVEAVLLWHHGRWTACVSSQSGCPLACVFCATGKLGLDRDLEAWEIVDQVTQVGRLADVRISDIVFMGMGEPLLNEAAVYRAGRILREAAGFQISPRRITVSTAGVVPAIHRFIDAREPWRLVFSLGAADPEKRARLMPIQARWSYDAFLDAVRRYERFRGGRHVTLEYVAIRNLTMGDDDVEAIRKHLTGFNFILNVIPLNPVDDVLEAPTDAEVRAFTAKLRPLDIPVKIRMSWGRDELAGCGQLGRALMASGARAPRR